MLSLELLVSVWAQNSGETWELATYICIIRIRWYIEAAGIAEMPQVGRERREKGLEQGPIKNGRYKSEQR